MNSGCEEISSINFRIGFPLNLHTVIYNTDLKLKEIFCVPGLGWEMFRVPRTMAKVGGRPFTYQ
jgi:hypothetical protein